MTLLNGKPFMHEKEKIVGIYKPYISHNFFDCASRCGYLEGDKTISFIVSDGRKHRMQGGHVAAHWFAVHWSLYFNRTPLYM